MSVTPAVSSSRPPVLPQGARWVSVHNFAIRHKTRHHTVMGWGRKGLVVYREKAGGYGGAEVAVWEGEDWWPLDGPRVAEYQARRSQSARKGAAASVAVRRSRRRTEPFKPVSTRSRKRASK